MISPGCTFKILIKWFLLYWIKIAEKKIGIPELFEGNTYSAPSVYRPRFIANLAYRQNSRLSRFPPLYCQTQLPPSATGFQKHKCRKTNLDSPISIAHNYLLTAVY